MASRIFFTHSTASSGLELWLSDGTPGNAQLVKDINPGAGGSSPNNLTSVAETRTVFFAASNGSNGQELWKSNGTAAGTVMVKDINPGGQGSGPTNLVDVNGTLYFLASDGSHGNELWKSDGTANGTVMVADINPGSGTSSPTNLTNVNGTLYFVANDGTHGNELWKSDGTAAGTVQVADIVAGSSGSSPSSLVNFNGTLFFSVNDGSAYGSELWKSNGTAAGTVMVKDFPFTIGITNAADFSTTPGSLINVNGTLFFGLSSSWNGVRLWESSGSTAGTVEVKSGVYPYSPTGVGSTLYFLYSGLWASDGSNAGTVNLTGNLGPGFNFVSNLVDVNGTLFFEVEHIDFDNTKSGYYLWSSDGTALGTHLVKYVLNFPNLQPVVNPPPAGIGNFSAMTNVDGVLYFQATDGTGLRGLWRSDGTTAGTVELVADVQGSLTSLPANHAPLVAASDTQLAKGNANPMLSSLVSASDADGETITQWQFADGTLGNGHLVVGGMTQGEQQILTLTPAQFAGATFQSTTGSDDLYARAFDGIDYGAWKVFHITAPVNHAPVVAASDMQLAKGNANPLLSSLVSASDGDGDTITQWQLADGTLGNGHLVVGGMAQGEQQILTLTPAQFAGATFQSTTGTDELYARAFDGIDYGAWKVFHITAPVNHAPVVAAADAQLTKGNANPLVSSNVSASDVDGDAITLWQLADGTLGNGHLVLGRMAQGEQQIITLTPAQFAGATFQSTTGTDEIYARAFDGIDYGPWKVFHITAPVNHAPVVAAADAMLTKGNANPLLSSIVSASDADGEAITQWQIADGTLGNGHFVVGGMIQGEQQILTLTPAQFAGATFQSTSGTDELYARAFDGIDYGPWKVFHIAAPVNHAPMVAASDTQLTKGNANPLLSSIVSASDADGEPITQWQVADGTLGNGHLVVGGMTQGEQQILTLTPAQFAGATFQSTTGSDELYVRASDGIDYGAWKVFHITAPVNHAPVVGGGDASFAVNTTVAAADLFTFSDPDSDTITAFQFYDGTADPASGHFVIDGMPQASLQILAADLDHAAFVTGSVPGVDQIYARAFDGLEWGNWHPVNVTSHT